MHYIRLGIDMSEEVSCGNPECNNSECICVDCKCTEKNLCKCCKE